MSDRPRFADLTPLLNPASIAIIGATPDTKKVGGRPIRYLRRYGYRGTIYPVNPRYEAVQELRCFPSVAALPERPDMAVIALPAEAAIAAAEACVAAGVPALTVYSSSFREIGPEGEAREARLKAVIAAAGTVMCGPNCQGVANFHDSMVAYFTSGLGREDVPVGGIGFVTQSGLFGGMLAETCVKRGIGLGYMISSGNEAGLDFADAIVHMAADPRTTLIAGYMEGVGDLGRLDAALARARDLPVVILKVGRHEEAAAAAKAHTGADTGAWSAYEALFRRHGVIEVSSIETLYDVIEALSLGFPRPAGPRVGIITNSGGVGALCADQACALGLAVPRFLPETEAALRAGLPDFASPRNPVDMTLQPFSDPVSLVGHVQNVATDPNVDALLVFVGLNWLTGQEMAARLAALKPSLAKPMAVVWVGGDPKGVEILKAAGVPAFDGARNALEALRALSR
ncbi:MAG: acetate--CoA ligase family protein [Alphaproteobacteria bacterium]